MGEVGGPGSSLALSQETLGMMMALDEVSHGTLVLGHSDIPEVCE